MKEIDLKLLATLKRYADCGIAQQVDYEKYYLYSLITHSTAIEGSTVTEIENQLLFDEGIAAKGEYIQALINSRENEDSAIVQDVMLTQHIANLESRILQYQKSLDDTVNKTANDTVSRLVAIIKERPDYTYDEYANVLGVGRATVARHIKKLNGTVIKRIGSDKSGHWEFIKQDL